MLKIATLIENSGEPTPQSQYHDPQQLKALGYNTLVIYQTTGLAGVQSPDVIDSQELRRWTSNHFDHITNMIEHAGRSGLDVLLFYDVLVLARDAVRANADALICRNRPMTMCPASEPAMELSLAALNAQLQRWPSVQGIVLRFGDNDASRMPFLVGNDIYSPHCPRCSQLGRADRVIKFIERFHNLVVQQHHKRLVVRAWNVRPGGMHDSLELAQRIAERLPGKPTDSSLILSFKFTQTDFWRYQPWNRCSLAFGKRPIVYELQCQREFEGKGGIPNWQVPLWRDGASEVAQRSEVHGLADAAGRVNLVGLWAWVRGGGWGGPFVSKETWIDANVFAVPRLADDPAADMHNLAEQWIDQRLGITDPQVAEQLLEILEHSEQVIRDAFYVAPFAQRKSDDWHPNADWIQDDLLDVQSVWRMIQRLPAEELDRVAEQKRLAAEQMSHDRAALQQLVNDANRSVVEPLVHSLIYAESLFETLRDLLGGLVAYRQFQAGNEPAHADRCRRKLRAAQTHWNQHTQHDGSLKGAATAFREIHLWEVTERLLAALPEPVNSK